MRLTRKLTSPVEIVELLAVNVGEVIHCWNKVRIQSQDFFVTIARLGKIPHSFIDYSRCQERRRVLRILRQNRFQLLQCLGKLVSFYVDGDEKIVGGGQVWIELDRLLERGLSCRKILLRDIASAVDEIGRG